MKKILKSSNTIEFLCDRCGCYYLSNEYRKTRKHKYNPRGNVMGAIITTSITLIDNCPECGKQVSKRY